MKLHKTIGLLSLLAVMLPLSCKESYLEQKNTQGITEDALFKKPADGVALVTGIYDAFHDVDFTLKALWYQANFLSQDFKNYGADTFFETYEVPTDFAALDLFWSRAYQGVARANSAIPIIANMRTNNVISDSLANRLTGETLFLRGMFYYYLASNFGGVPLELKTVTDDGRHPRNTQDEVFTAVAADMKAAA
ncbi:MAG: RagB/SusD family nutrient uptake outer membrane protein, partial [Bacteroidetes bacterium]|nr:RagB/SusD family nutrient uptake outer membrane protein [Fibrella sp.]